MTKPANYPSIFNDVIGPVMRGPSSSHCAAAVRIGRLARELMDGNLSEVLVEFDPNGSLATTYEPQGSAIGLCGGLMGWEATDERLVDSPRLIGEKGIIVRPEIVDIGATHPNTYHLILRNDKTQHEMTVLSVGGGMLEVIDIDQTPLFIAGDYFETLFDIEGDGQAIVDMLQQRFEQADDIRLIEKQNGCMVQVKGQCFVDDELIDHLKSCEKVRHAFRLSPVLPVLSRKEMDMPFGTYRQMMEYNRSRGRSLWELAVDYECARSGWSSDQVIEKMKQIVAILRQSIEQGLAGTEYEDRILGYQSGTYRDRWQQGKLLDAGMLNRMISYVSALMEVKSAMGVIVAAPTAGSCGALPGACLGAVDSMGLSDDDAAKAMLAAGLIGVFIAAESTFAAEVGGCQAECGAGSAMSAAALVTLANGSVDHAIGAASMAIQSTLGLICDPVANRVEWPCLGKNVLAVSNALATSNMAMADFDPVVPLDEVIATMDRVGKALPSELRCTALGGLAITETAKAIELKLNGKSIPRN